MSSRCNIRRVPVHWEKMACLFPPLNCRRNLFAIRMFDLEYYKGNVYSSVFLSLSLSPFFPPRDWHVLMRLCHTLVLYKSEKHNIKSQLSNGISRGAELLHFGCLDFQWVYVFTKWVFEHGPDCFSQVSVSSALFLAGTGK